MLLSSLDGRTDRNWKHSVREKLKNQFSQINWGNRRKGVPRSGPGSTLAHTSEIRKALPELILKYDIKTVVDAPCGDWHWMQHVDLKRVSYLGIDIVPDLVESNVQNHATKNVQFALSDITSDPLPQSDLVLCRDCLFHLKYWLRWAFFENFVESKSTWLLTTTYDCSVNRNVPQNGKFRYFNMELAPFSFPPPRLRIPDDPGDGTELRFTRSIGLWHRDQILEGLRNRDKALSVAEDEAPD